MFMQLSPENSLTQPFKHKMKFFVQYGTQSLSYVNLFNYMRCKFTLYAVHFTLYAVHFTLYVVPFILYALLFLLYAVLLSLYAVLL